MFHCSVQLISLKWLLCLFNGVSLQSGRISVENELNGVLFYYKLTDEVVMYG